MTRSNDSNALDREHALSLLTEMMRIRRFEERCVELYSSQKIRGFLHLYIGEEAVAVGVMQTLQANDTVIATYREHGHALAKGVPMNSIMAEMYGKQAGCSRGRGGSMHLFDASHGFYGGNAIVGGHLPLAVGLALANKMQAVDSVCVCFFGEGAVAEGEFHESMNLATLWKLPVVFVCENNGYAMGTALERSESQTDIRAKAAAYGMLAEQVDGMDVVAVEAAARKATEFVRETSQPYFLECKTYRFRAHSMFDAELYRDKSEVARFKSHGPIRTFKEALKELELITDQDIASIDSQISAEIDAAVEFSEKAELEPVSDLTRDVYTREPSA